MSRDITLNYKEMENKIKMKTETLPSPYKCDETQISKGIKSWVEQY